MWCLNLFFDQKCGHGSTKMNSTLLKELQCLSSHDLILFKYKSHLGTIELYYAMTHYKGFQHVHVTTIFNLTIGLFDLFEHRKDF